MKKYYVLAAAVIALAACSSEEENEQAWNDGEIRLSAVNVVESRAAQGIQSTEFLSGEKIAVFINEDTSDEPSVTYTQPVVYTTDDAGNLSTTTPQFYPQNGNGVNIFGVYPYDAATDVNGTAVAFSVQSNQNTEANYKASDLMVGKPASNPVSKSTSSVQLNFNHCLTKININLLAGDGMTNNELNGAEVTIGGVTNSATFNVKSGVVTAVTGTAAADYVELGGLTANNGTIGGSAIIIPQDVTSGTDFFKIVIEPNSNNPTVYTYTLPANTTFTAGAAFTYNITVKKSGLTMSPPTITNWLDGGTVNGDAVPVP